MTYHLVSRCVRRSWLCGTDPLTRRNYDHRKSWLERRLLRLSSTFAVELYGYAIMSNHFHLVIRYHPTAAATWSDADVVDRWLDSCSINNAGKSKEAAELREVRRDQLLSSPDHIERLRRTLGSLSFFMKHLKQPIAWRANREDQCTGHFFEGRFYSAALLDEAAVVNAMAYVDLNPVRAKLVKSAVEAGHTSLARRLRDADSDKRRLEEYLQPLVSGISPGKESNAVPIFMTLRSYTDYVGKLSLPANDFVDEQSRWYQRLELFKRKQRAYGYAANLVAWAAERGWSRIGVPLS